MPTLSLAMFESVVFGGRYAPPPPEVVSSLQALSKLVGSPSYSRTPNFRREVFQNKKWDNFRVFKKTEIVAEPKTAVEACATVVRGLLNKLTERTVDTTTASVLEAVQSSDLSSEDVSALCDVICEIGSASAYYAGTYAKIAAAMLESVSPMRGVIEAKLDGFADSLLEITSVSADDYDAFCKMNAQKEARKGSGLFLINLAKNGVVPTSYVIATCSQLDTMIRENLDDSEKRQHLEDLSAMLIAFLRETDSELRSEIGTMVIGEIAKMSRKDHAGLSSKTIFAAMDYLEECL